LAEVLTTSLVQFKGPVWWLLLKLLVDHLTYLQVRRWDASIIQGNTA